MLILHSKTLVWLWGFHAILSHTYVIPEQHHTSLVARDPFNPHDGSILHERGPKKTKPKPMKKPAAATTKTASPAKPLKSSKFNASPAQKPPLAKRPSPTPEPSKVVFPKLKVPYKSAAYNLCNYYVDCFEDTTYGTSNAVAQRDMQEREHGNHHTHALSKRRTPQTVKLPAGKTLRLSSLDYPSSSELYTGPRSNNPKHIFQFKSDQLTDAAVKDTSVVPMNTEEFATEHIIELQSIGQFMQYAIGEDKTLETFFEQKWLRTYFAKDIAARKHKPGYDTAANRRTLNALVMDALGSNLNPKDFILCEGSINSMKEHLWRNVDPMGEKLYQDAVKDAMNGVVPSSEYLSALRTTIAVYGYLNSQEVVSRMRSINANVKLELRNAAQITKSPKIKLEALWDQYLADKFATMETNGRKWIEERLKVDTDKQLKATIEKYQKMSSALKKEENTPPKKSLAHAKKQNVEKNRLDKIKKQRQADVTAQQKIVDQLRMDRAALSTKIKKATEPVVKQSFAKQRDDVAKKLKAAKNQVHQKQKLVDGTQRAIHELYSYSVQDILTNLDKDKKIIAEYRKVVSTLRMPRP